MSPWIQHVYNYSIVMSISSTGLYGSATIVNSDLFNDVEDLKEQVTTLSTSYLDTTREHREDISQNRFDISSNLSKINDISGNKIPALESDISDNLTNVIRSVRSSHLLSSSKISRPFSARVSARSLIGSPRCDFNLSEK